MKLRIFVFFLGLMSAFPAYAGKTFHSETFTLENGLQVVVIPNHRAPVVTSMVWYKVGAADEPFGAAGMAHYFEHLMFKGTQKLKPGEFSTTVKKLGGNDNAFTGQDYTAYFQSIAVDKLETVLKMEADRMVNLMPPPDHYASEKQVVLEERRQRTDNDPRAQFDEQMQSALYINHPYGRPIIGWMSEIQTYEWSDVKKFYDTWYAPNNAVLVISGDITLSKIKPMAEEIFGSIPPKNIPQRKRPDVQPGIARTVLEFSDESIHQPSLDIMLLAPSYRQNKGDALALSVLQEIMDGGASTRLYKSLVVEQKKATSVSFRYDYTSYDTTTLSIGATPASGVGFEELETLIQNEFKKIILEGVSEEENNEAILRLKDYAVYARDSVTGPAMLFGQTITTGGTVEDLEQWPDNIAGVTPAQVLEVAKKYLDFDSPWIRPAVVGIMTPKESQ